MNIETKKNGFPGTNNLVPDPNHVSSMKKLLAEFPQLLLKETFFPVAKTEKKTKHTCESIHNLAYDDVPFKTPLLISAFMILLNSPIVVYTLKNETFDGLLKKLSENPFPIIEEDEFNSSVIKFLSKIGLFNSKKPNNALLVGKYEQIPEKRIGVMDLKQYKDHKKVKLLENISFTKTNWGSFAFIKGKTVNDTKIENQTLILKYQIINLLSASFGFKGLHEVCPQVAAAAATLQYSLDVSSGLESNSLKGKNSYKKKVEEKIEEKEKIKEEKIKEEKIKEEKIKEEKIKEEKIKEEKIKEEKIKEKVFVKKTEVPFTPQKVQKGSTSSSTPSTEPEITLKMKSKLTPVEFKFKGSIDTLLSFKN
jgi:hypothetical protein